MASSHTSITVAVRSYVMGTLRCASRTGCLGVPDLRAITAQVQFAVPLPPWSGDGDMDRSGRMAVSRPRPGHPGGRQSQIGPEEPAHSVRHLQGDIAVHRPG